MTHPAPAQIAAQVIAPLGKASDSATIPITPNQLQAIIVSALELQAAHTERNRRVQLRAEEYAQKNGCLRFEPHNCNRCARALSHAENTTRRIGRN